MLGDKKTSEKYFLQKGILTAEDAKGSYAMMSRLDVDAQAKQAYENMVSDITRHLTFLNNRAKYLQKQTGNSN